MSDLKKRLSEMNTEILRRALFGKVDTSIREEASRIIENDEPLSPEGAQYKEILQGQN